LKDVGEKPKPVWLGKEADSEQNILTMTAWQRSLAVQATSLEIGLTAGITAGFTGTTGLERLIVH
jgi:hypothetical protein